MSGGVGPEREARRARVKRARLHVKELYERTSANDTLAAYETRATLRDLLAELEAAKKRMFENSQEACRYKEQLFREMDRAEAAEKALREIAEAHAADPHTHTGMTQFEWARATAREALAGSAARTESEPA